MFSSCFKAEENIGVNSRREAFQTEEAYPLAQKELYQTASGIVLEKLDSIYIMHGDAVLSPSQVAILDDSICTRGAITKQLARYWSECKVYYEFASNFTYQYYVQQALDEISSVFGIKFFPATIDSRIRFIHGDGNYSQIGCIGGVQDISIQSGQPASYIKGIVMHEVCHALGLFHEQCRADRDNYVDILWDNIESSKKHNFQTYVERKLPGDDIGDFNFNSIMMYGSTDFGKKVGDNRLTTIRKKDGGSYFAQRYYLASSDIAAIQAIYGPPYARSRSEIEIIQERLDYGDELYEYETHEYVDFYSDEECTIPATLTTPRYLSVYHKDQTEPSSYVEYYSVEIIPAGVSSYHVASGYVYLHEIQGTAQSDIRRDVGILNVHKRK